LILCAAGALAAGCALPLGEDYIRERNNTGALVIGSYDLQVYVPVPVAGAEPVTTLNRGDLDVQAVWKDAEGSDITGALSRFAMGEVYQADITISAKNGWSFDSGLNFQYPAGSVAVQPGANGDPSRRVLSTITYRAAAAAKIIDHPIDLTELIPAPYAGGTPVTSFISPTLAYSGKVSWKEGADAPMRGEVFQYGETYQAEAVLTAAPGFVFPAVLTDTDFTHMRADPRYPPAYTGISGGGGMETVTVTFEATPVRREVLNYDLAAYIPLPVAGKTPVWAFDKNGVTGTVSWDYYTTQGDQMMSPMAAFRCDIIYRAQITLRAKDGYKFDSTPFDYGAGLVNSGPIGDQSGTESRSITVVYKEFTGSFASEGTEGSALWRIRAAKDGFTSEAAAFYIDISPGTEGVSLASGSLGTAGAVLNSSNSPQFVRIDGRGRKVQLTGSGTGSAVITVGSGVTLYLRNITLAGIGDNTAPVITVDGGTLVLEDGAVVGENTNTTAGNAGGGIGVINYGTLYLAGASAAIKDNKSDERGNGNGVYVGSTGKFIMEAGEISTNTGGVHNAGTFIMKGGAISGNYAYHGGGGVHNTGTFTMEAGKISGNNDEDGGGVYNSGSFKMEAGEISGNTASSNGGGGVYNTGDFVMRGGEISGRNTASNGGGVYNTGTFTMWGGGAISGNTASNGGGLYNTGAFTSWGTISGNTATYGGGVYNNTGTFIMESGEIIGNETSQDGGGVFVYSGTFNIKGGTIFGYTNWRPADNTASGNGDAVYLDGGTWHNKRANSSLRLYASGQSGSWVYVDPSGPEDTWSNWDPSSP
jgi:hypothetical protein